MKKTLNIEIGTRVRQARERLHLSRETLAELLNISTLFLGYIECGQKGMSIETLIAVCKTLNTSADFILMGKEPSQKSATTAERLLHDMPPEYLPLADESIRALVKAIATVQANSGTTQKKPSHRKASAQAARDADRAPEAADPAGDKIKESGPDF